MSNLSNPTEITPQSNQATSKADPTSVPKDVLNELLLIFSVIGSTTTSKSDKPNNLNDPIDTNIVPVADCLNWLQDLQRALRRDDDSHRPISILLANWKMVEHKLIPLAISCKYDTAIVMTITKILVILTKPMSARSKRAARLILNPKKTDSAVIKEQIKSRENAIQQSEMLMQYKKFIVQHDSGVRSDNGKRKGNPKTSFLSIIVSLLSEPLSRTGSARTDSDHLSIELVLHLFRNLLSAEPLVRASSEATEKASTLHRQLISLFHQEDVLEVILVLSQDMEARENAHYNLLLMEILHSLIRGQDPVLVAQSYQKSAADSMARTQSKSARTAPQSVQPQKQTSSLLSLLRNEKKRSITTPNRHSNFGGMIALKTSTGKKCILSTNRVFSSSTNSIYGKGNGNANVSTHLQKPKRKNVKHSAFIGSKSNTTDDQIMNQNSSPLQVKFLKALYTFSKSFLSKAYGPLTKSLKNEFRRESSRLEASDKQLYFKIVCFFSAFGRYTRKHEPQKQQQLQQDEILDDSAIGPLVFTMDIFSFSLLFKSIVSYNDQKKYLELAQSIQLYKEMMYLLYEMTISKDETERDMALGLMDRLFYSNEPTDLVGKLFSWWKPGIGTRDYLADLVELQHVSLKLLDGYAKDGAGTDEEQKKKKKRKIVDENHGDMVARIRREAEEFDVNTYFGKLVSNHTLYMYTMILAEYLSNSPQVNHHIIAFFNRMCKFIIYAPVDDLDEYSSKELRLKKTTFEPMLYNIHLLTVFSKILNDSTIRDKKEYSQVLQFSATILRHFGVAAQENHMLFVETLFRFPHPHRVCEMINNQYVNEELVMIAEREILLERAREEEGEDWEENNNDDNATLEEDSKSAKKPTNDGNVSDDDDEELEFEDDINNQNEVEKRDDVSISDYVTNKDETLDVVLKGNVDATNEKIDDGEKQSPMIREEIMIETNKRKRIKKISQESLEDSDDDDAFGTAIDEGSNANFLSSQIVFDDDE